MSTSPAGAAIDLAQVAAFASLKGEFEAEGLSREELAVEVAWGARRGLDYLVKIGGCEAKSDLLFLERLGVTSVVAPMIESAFAMSKYMGALPGNYFHEVGVTIETKDAVERIEAILDAGTKLTNVTLGRSDLTASIGGAGVDEDETMDMVRTVGRAAKARGLEVTMGGGVNVRTRDLLARDAELAALLTSVETRKVVIPVAAFLESGTLERAIQIELALLDLHTGPAACGLDKARARSSQIRERL
ncbi:HpcH/HpaI aldolase/citrate lyase domain-containing protein [Sphingomonas antarctica]|uniref:aldolase/citrate lyase family protein n=1 Tax=Sphingomonas antarctica TaxID=2040274 RepID=UPI0039E921CF